MAKTKENELTIVQPEFTEIVSKGTVELTKAQSHASKFAPLMERYHEKAKLLSTLNRENPTPEDAKIARRARLDLVPIRTEAGDVKDELKAVLLIETNLIQDLYNVVKNTCSLTESEFMEIEKHQERIEAENKAKLKSEREALLLPYETDTTYIALAEMTEDQFQGLLAKEKLAFETAKENARLAELARIEAEQKAEAEKLEAERLEKERIEAQRIENERLKAEAESREKELISERERIAKEQAEKDMLAKIEADRLAKIAADEKAKSDKLAAELKAEQDKAKQAQEAEKLRIEQEEAEKLAKEKALLLAPDKEKVKVFFEKLKSLEFPELESEAGKAMSVRVKEALQMVKQLIIEYSKTLL